MLHEDRRGNYIRFGYPLAWICISKRVVVVVWFQRERSTLIRHSRWILFNNRLFTPELHRVLFLPYYNGSTKESFVSGLHRCNTEINWMSSLCGLVGCQRRSQASACNCDSCLLYPNFYLSPVQNCWTLFLVFSEETHTTWFSGRWRHGANLCVRCATGVAEVYTPKAEVIRNPRPQPKLCGTHLESYSGCEYIWKARKIGVYKIKMDEGFTRWLFLVLLRNPLFCAHRGRPHDRS